MKTNQSYPCEVCGRMTAQFEARFFQQANLLLCFTCLQKLQRKDHSKTKK